MKVTIIILNWNRAKDTLECLESLKKMSLGDCRLSVLVVDNASIDYSVEKLRTYQKANRFELLINKSNLGFAGGNNVGIRYALERGADYVMVLNNDTRVDPLLVTRIIEVAEKYPDFGAASPKIYFEKGYEFHKKRYKKVDLGKVIWYAGGKIDWNNVYGVARGVDEVDKGQFERVEDTDFATGTCMLLSRKALREVGMFNERYFMYYEDTELSVRMKKNGYKVLYVPKASVWHKVAQSSGIGSELNDYFITRNRLLFAFRYASIRTKFAIFRESLKLFLKGRRWQKKGVKDFYFANFGKGSWK